MVSNKKVSSGGADHGLELDAFNVDAVSVMKGPASLLYGSDAMGGVIDISPVQVPAENMLFGDVTLLGKSVNETFGASLMLGIKRMPGIRSCVIPNSDSGIIVSRWIR